MLASVNSGQRTADNRGNYSWLELIEKFHHVIKTVLPGMDLAISSVVFRNELSRKK